MQRKKLIPFGMWMIFEIVAVALWLTRDNMFYLLNFTYIGSAIALGVLLFQFNYRHARRIVLDLETKKTVRLKELVPDWWGHDIFR